MICRICNAWLLEHPTAYKFLKCIGCGLTRLKTELITLENYITASGKYKDRKDSPELTEEVKTNAKTLLEKVNMLLDELGIKDATVSSGFRPSSVNSAIANAAKKSSHMTGKAIDLVDDKNQTLAKLIAKHPESLRKLGLFLEDPDSTKGANSNWCHLDIATRSDRPSRIFKP